MMDVIVFLYMSTIFVSFASKYILYIKNNVTVHPIFGSQFTGYDHKMYAGMIFANTIIPMYFRMTLSFGLYITINASVAAFSTMPAKNATNGLQYFLKYTVYAFVGVINI